MIYVEIFRDSHGDICKFSINGHAGFDDYGKDIVCAAVSAISQTAILGLNSLSTVKYKKQIGKGSINIKIEKNGLNDECIKLRAILDTMVLGLKDIAKDYPNNVNVVDRRCI